MNRFFVDINNVYDSYIIIDDTEDINHIGKVLRLKNGDSVIVSDNNSWEYICEIDFIERDFIQCKILDKHIFRGEEDVKISLYQGMPKSNKFEYIIQKNIELGVFDITPVIMDRTIGRDKDKRQKKSERYEKVAMAAAKQSHRGIIPKIHGAMDFSSMIGYMNEYDLVVFPYENEENKTIKDLFIDIEQNHIKNVAIIIGPEGGFSKSEVEQLTELGISPVTLGKGILRTETAGLVAVACIKYALCL